MAVEGLEVKKNNSRPQVEAGSLPINGLGARNAPSGEGDTNDVTVLELFAPFAFDHKSCD
jgi:hypothetical protein